MQLYQISCFFKKMLPQFWHESPRLRGKGSSLEAFGSAGDLIMAADLSPICQFFPRKTHFFVAVKCFSKNCGHDASSGGQTMERTHCFSFTSNVSVVFLFSY